MKIETSSILLIKNGSKCILSNIKILLYLAFVGVKTIGSHDIVINAGQYFFLWLLVSQIKKHVEHHIVEIFLGI